MIATTHWDIERVKSIMASQEEGTMLDYKRPEKLVKTQKQKVDIAQIVSAFANSAGGVVIFGVDGEVTPKELHPINIDQWKKENGVEPELWLSNILESNIRRKIPGLAIHTIPIAEGARECVIVVEVPQSFHAPHQLVKETNKFAFYKRAGSSNNQMEEYEIRDILTRQTAPDLWLNFKLVSTHMPNGPHNSQFNLFTSISNVSKTPAHCAVITLEFGNRLLAEDLNRAQIDSEFEIENKTIKAKKFIYYLTPSMPIFGDNTFGYTLSPPRIVSEAPILTKVVPPINQKNWLNITGYIKWQIDSPGMPSRIGYEKIQTGDQLFQDMESPGNSIEYAVGITHTSLTPRQ